jgi:hypothetical protein
MDVIYFFSKSKSLLLLLCPRQGWHKCPISFDKGGIFLLFGRFLGNNSLVGPLPGLGSLINLQELYVTATD